MGWAARANPRARWAKATTVEERLAAAASVIKDEAHLKRILKAAKRKDRRVLGEELTRRLALKRREL